MVPNGKPERHLLRSAKAAVTGGANGRLTPRRTCRQTQRRQHTDAQTGADHLQNRRHLPRFARHLESPVGSASEARYLSGIPLGRFGQPGELAAAIAFLLSEDAGFITGQTLRVDGGASIGGAV